MKRALLLIALGPAALALGFTTTTRVSNAFTDADLGPAGYAPTTAEALPTVKGTVKDGVKLTHAVSAENPLLKQSNGYISFWIQPAWNGNDGETHRLLRVGDPAQNGLLLEKSARGMLRFVMSSPEKSTASRADVSAWKAGDWHHVAIAWFSRDDKPIGLPLWIDRVAVAGPIAGECRFLDPSALEDKRIWLGDESSKAVIDELIFRNDFTSEGGNGMVAVVYRDYFRTAPYTTIKINPDALFVRSDRRVVEGHQKQFGLLAKLDGQYVPVTDFAVRYGQWANFDAKPLITWATSDEMVATVDENGRVTGQGVGPCRLTAEYRGMKASYDVKVISADRPDLDLIYVERLPRYRSKQLRGNPTPGDTVKSVAHFENFGFKPVPAGTVVRFELIPDANADFRLDDNEKPVATTEQTLDQPLAPREAGTVEFEWTWPEKPVWVRVTLDPADAVDEICEANNQRCELNIARPMQWGYHDKTLKEWYEERTINHVGSFSHYDWINAQCERFNLMLRESVDPGTTPHGIDDALRSDKFTEMLPDTDWGDQTWVKNEIWFDGGFPVGEKVDPMAIDAAILHEYGHTCEALPDLYGYPISQHGVLLKDAQGELYAGSELLPAIRGDTLSMPTACAVPCDVGYSSLMNFCHLWLHPAHSGKIQHFAGYRGPRFWGVQGRLIPLQENLVQVFDINDKPLEGAAVYVYHTVTPNVLRAASKYFPDRPKYMGHTDEEGRWVFPRRADKGWDCSQTDEVEGDFPTWNPFAGGPNRKDEGFDCAFTPNVWSVEGLLLLKIIEGDQVEFAWLCLTDFNEEYFKGHQVRGVYPIRTSLKPVDAETPLVRPNIPEAIRKTNLRPIATIKRDTKKKRNGEQSLEITIKPGEQITFDGSPSHDPEGQPLLYRWESRHHRLKPDYSEETTFTLTAPKAPDTYKICFWVIDGLRSSQPVWIKLKVVEPAKAGQEGG